jgi:hypothetical protein
MALDLGETCTFTQSTVLLMNSLQIHSLISEPEHILQNTTEGQQNTARQMAIEVSL